MLSITERGDNPDLTLAVLGCGQMGIAILSGILASLEEMSGPKPLQVLPSSGSSTPRDEPPARLPSRFFACVRTPDAAKKVKKDLWQYSSSVKVFQNDNISAVTQADVVLLACKPWMVDEILRKHGMTRALQGKLLISICAGITTEYIENALYGAVSEHDPESDGRCRIVRAMPNAASCIRESMTVIADSVHPMPPHTAALVTWIFRRIGDVVYLPAENMDASTALCGSGPGFFALMLEAAIDGAVSMGLPRDEATRMAAQSMRGTASLVLDGENPGILRQKVSTPGGCTIGGVLVLEEGGVRGSIARAVRESTAVAGQLGKGLQGVNTTHRFRE